MNEQEEISVPFTLEEIETFRDASDQEALDLIKKKIEAGLEQRGCNLSDPRRRPTAEE